MAATAKEQGWEIEGVVNFETIAYAGDELVQKAPDNIPFEMPKVGNFIAVVGNENSAEMVKSYIRVIEQYQIPLPSLWPASFLFRGRPFTIGCPRERGSSARYTSFRSCFILGYWFSSDYAHQHG